MVLYFKHQFLNIGLNIRKSTSLTKTTDSAVDPWYECRGLTGAADHGLRTARIEDNLFVFIVNNRLHYFDEVSL